MRRPRRLAASAARRGDVCEHFRLCHAIGKCVSSSQNKYNPVVVTFEIQREDAMRKTALARRFGLLGVSLAALALSQGVRAEDAIEAIKTSSPIKHVIIIVGENRSFDHLFATYVPKSDDERVLNLLSQGIVKSDGSPGPNCATR